MSDIQALLDDLRSLEDRFRNITNVRRVEAFRGIDGTPVDADGWEPISHVEKGAFRTAANHIRELRIKHEKSLK